MQLSDDFKEKRRYWKLKQEAPDHSMKNSYQKRLWTGPNTD